MHTALVVGGTGATGPGIVAALRGRDYDVTVYHRGLHEVAEVDDLEHIHGNPYAREGIARDLYGRSWDVTVATYGSIRTIAKGLRGRTGHLVALTDIPSATSVSGVPTFVENPHDEVPRACPAGVTQLQSQICSTERVVLDADRAGHFAGTIVRYPYVYGPRARVPLEWLVLKRALDGRSRWITRGCGLAIKTRCASINAARLVGLVLDHPEIAGGATYQAADTRQYTLREWVTMVADAAGHEFEFVDIPPAVAVRAAVPTLGSAGRADSAVEAEPSHVLASNEKARVDLGYEDVVTADEWIVRTVEHWLRNPPSLNGNLDNLTARDFDYAAEDLLLGYWDRVVAGARAEAVTSST
jgi:nucleoside-diphosphate-sugar epimerase